MSERDDEIVVSIPAEERGAFERMVREQLRGDMELIGEIQEGLGGEHADDAEALASVSMCLRILGEHLTPPSDDFVGLLTTGRRRRVSFRSSEAQRQRAVERDVAAELRKRRMAEARAVQALASSVEELGYFTVPPRDGEVCRFRTPSGAQYGVRRPASGRLHPRHVEMVLAAMLRADTVGTFGRHPLDGLTIVPHDDPHEANEPMK